LQTDRPNLLIKKQAGRRRAFVHIDHDERPEEIVPVVGNGNQAERVAGPKVLLFFAVSAVFLQGCR
jgi:hypothetical protein